jgi:hypothetical protein
MLYKETRTIDKRLSQMLQILSNLLQNTKIQSI